jgi:hypothetical protein
MFLWNKHNFKQDYSKCVESLSKKYPMDMNIYKYSFDKVLKQLTDIQEVDKYPNIILQKNKFNKIFEELCQKYWKIKYSRYCMNEFRESRKWIYDSIGTKNDDSFTEFLFNRFMNELMNEEYEEYDEDDEDDEDDEEFDDDEANKGLMTHKLTIEFTREFFYSCVAMYVLSRVFLY